MSFPVLLYLILGCAGQILFWLSRDPLYQVTGIFGGAFLPAVLWFAWRGRRRKTDRNSEKQEQTAARKSGRGGVLTEALAAVWIPIFTLWNLSGFVIGEKVADFSGHDASLRMFALAMLLWFIPFACSIYIREWLKFSPDENQLPVYHILNAWIWLHLIAAAVLGLEYFGWASGYLAGGILIAILSLLPCLELLGRSIVRMFLPRKPGRQRPCLLHFHLFEVLAEPGKMTGFFQDGLQRQLGMTFGGGQFLQIAFASLLPLLLLSVVLIWLLSAVIVLEPGEAAMVLRFGRPTERILDEGLNFKAPWPVESIRRMNVWKIRRIRVGSHRPRTEDEELYRAEMPILWTNNHGLTDEELLIVAPPRDLLQQKQGLRQQKTPSVSLIGADITVEYRVSSLYQYFMAGQDVKAYFEQLAMQCASRALFQYDVDEFFCLGRIELPQVLHQELQRTADRRRLGITVLHVGLGGVHPPQAVAGDFQATVSALQRKMTIIEEARQEEINRLVKVAGTVEFSRRLLESEKFFNAGSFQAEGQVAEILAKARAYRCEKANSEIGKADRFLKERLLYRAAPSVYLNHRMMSSLEEGLSNSFKYMLIGDRDKMILRFRKNNVND